MDKLPLLKQTILNALSNVIRLAQKGYPLSGYCQIREAMLAINLIENFTIPSSKVSTIVDYYLRSLNNL